MAGEQGTREHRWRENNGGSSGVWKIMAGEQGTREYRWRENNGGSSGGGKYEPQYMGQHSGKTKKPVKCDFRHGQSRNMAVGPAVTRKAESHADQQGFGAGRAETALFRRCPCRNLVSTLPVPKPSAFGSAVADAALFSKILENARHFPN